MPLSKRILFFLIAIAIVVWGIKWYHADRVFHQKHRFEKYHWNSNDTLNYSLEVEEGDFKEGVELSLELRYIYGCSYNKIPVMLEITKPDSSRILKEAIIQIRDKNGDYQGDGMGDYWDVTETITADSMFSISGNYKLKLWSGRGSLFLVDDIIVTLKRR